MNHEMKLNPAPYAAIKTGKKNIELRLNDEKRQQVKVGDTITFSNIAIPDLKLYTRVNALHQAVSFGMDLEVEYITDMETIVSYGVMSMPALVINEKVVSMGKALKSADVIKLLKKLGYC